jgi:L,D-transpeptidase YcbB
MDFASKNASIILFCMIVLFVACNDKKVTDDGYVITNPSSKDEEVQSSIENILATAADNNFKLDSIPLGYFKAIKNYYEKTENLPVWSSDNKWNAAANNLVKYLKNAQVQGLFPADYNYTAVQKLKTTLDNDSLKKLPQTLWANADVLMTNAYMGLLKDLKQGRLVADTLSWASDTSKYNKYFGLELEKAKQHNNIDSLLEKVQPTHEGYVQLKKGIKKFVDSMDTHNYTYVPFPFKDSIAGVKALKKRLIETGISIETAGIVKTVPDSVRRYNPDSIALSNALKNYQRRVGITADGKLGNEVIKKLNTSDRQRFNSIAISLDRYKLLPEKMPVKYIWVNLPAYNLKVYENDTVAMESRVIVGKVATPTPTLTSDISDIVLYPTWTVPTSIISKDMLPGLKRNPNYLARRGLYLLNGKGKKIDAGSINWEKYTKGIPFRIQQGSGDGNALGVVKFNFDNPFSVYLHDTNQRYLFKNGVRCLSHGCVRVQDWKALANYIVRNDSLLLPKGDSLKCNTDSIKNWMAEKRNRRIDVKNKMPLFIRYIGCEGINGTIKFYDDIYYDDRDMKLKYFANK